MIEWINKVLDRAREVWCISDSSSKVEKLSNEEQELLVALWDVDRPLYEVASALGKSETRTRYEVKKLERDCD